MLGAGIQDVWRFTKGDLANAISLGLFSNRAPAETHRRAVRRKGLEAEVWPRIRGETTYRLDFRNKNEQELPPEIQEELA